MAASLEDDWAELSRGKGAGRSVSLPYFGEFLGFGNSNSLGLSQWVWVRPRGIAEFIDGCDQERGTKERTVNQSEPRVQGGLSSL